MNMEENNEILEDVQQEVVAEESVAKKAAKAMVEDEGGERKTNLSWVAVLNGEMLNSKWFRKQIGAIILLAICLFAYIANRYAAQQEMIEIDKLKREVQDAKFLSLSESALLEQNCRQSSVEEYFQNIGDTTMKSPNIPPIVLKMKKN